MSKSKKHNTITMPTLLIASVSFTDTQLKSMPLSAPMEIIPAPGIGKVIIPISIITDTNIVTPYTVGGLLSVEGDTFSMLFGGGMDVLVISNTAIVQNGFHELINNSSFKVSPPVSLMYYDSDWNGILPAGISRDKSFYENLPLNVTMSTTNGDLTDGDSANYMKITALYVIIDL